MNGKGRKEGCLILALIMLLMVVGLCGCSAEGGAQKDGGEGKSTSFSSFGAGETIRIVSGSENRELEHILEKCAKKTRVNIEITYQGSVDIMRTLQAGAQEYDAVWPASSLWISLGDSQHLIKHAASVSTTPVVFGIRESLAQELGFVGREASVSDASDGMVLKKDRLQSETEKETTLVSNIAVAVLIVALFIGGGLLIRRRRKSSGI